MAIKVKIEKSKDGTYWGTTQNIPGSVTADGNTLQELKENLKDAVELYAETAKEHEMEIYQKLKKGFELELEIELSQVFKKVKVLNKSEFAKRVGINPALMRQYATQKNHLRLRKKSRRNSKRTSQFG